jgi:hypothetical protein
LGAAHIGNIIIGELMNSGASNYKGLDISSTYFGLAELVTFPPQFGKAQLSDIQKVDVNLLEPPRTKEYYLKTHFNIYAEHGLQDPDQ